MEPQNNKYLLKSPFAERRLQSKENDHHSLPAKRIHYEAWQTLASGVDPQN